MSAVLRAGLLTVASLAFAPVALAATPSFDCEGATAEVPRLICGDDELAGLDMQLARAFATALARAEAQDVNEMKAAQDDWLKRRDACATSDDPRSCTRSAYEARLDEL